MDPISVLRVLWNHRLIAFSVLALTAAAGAYVFFFSARSFESVAVYALVNPQVPTAIQIERDPTLSELNSDNPYLRSSDTSLAAQVLVSKLSADDVADTLKARGLSTEYAVTRAEWSGQGLVLTVTADAETPAGSIATTKALSRMLVDQLRAIQTINGADERYLYTTLEVQAPDRAKEQISNRMRALIIVGVGGFVLLFGAVSIARSIDTARELKRATAAAAAAAATATDVPESRRSARLAARPVASSDVTAQPAAETSPASPPRAVAASAPRRRRESPQPVGGSSFGVAVSKGHR